MILYNYSWSSWKGFNDACRRDYWLRVRPAATKPRRAADDVADKIIRTAVCKGAVMFASGRLVFLSTAAVVAAHCSRGVRWRCQQRLGHGTQGDVPDGPASGERDEFADIFLMLPDFVRLSASGRMPTLAS